MPIQWFPGHMTKARREIAESISSNDLIIEVLDARMPRASENPLVAEMRGQKPCLKVLSKSDLADPDATARWIRWFETERAEVSKRYPDGNVRVAALRTDRPGETRRLVPELARKLAPHRVGPGKSVRALVVGIPNVGKSTLINTLAGRKAAKTGDRPAVTRGRQHVETELGLSLWDNPGIMWPNITSDAASHRLALGGAIPDTALEYENVALFGAKFLLERYPQLLRARYKLEALPETAAALLGEIGRKRGALRAGGIIDLHKAADVLIHDFRSGALGRISLEVPPEPSPAAG
jgi:ribosome biogenesis GTPase A